MTFLYILIAFFILIGVLMFIRLSVTVSYTDNVSVILKIGFIKFDMGKFSTKAHKEKKPTAEKKPKKAKEKEPAEPRKPLNVSDVIKLINDVLMSLIKKFLGYLRIDKYNISVTVATGDAATTAIMYGAATGALYSLTAILTTLKPRRKKGVYNAEVIPDFIGEKSSIKASISLSLLMWQALVCTVKGGSGFLKFYSKRNKNGNTTI
ncbi:MAG: hypothetical protein A2Y17_04070 [Clostridiales bacterium GWF2_38_85]|nr:MAG: hypothetical protein A2Y17_04070 [Clostridiales bacterium GWF2_38_85]HBL83470.1 hypothetical protein [Clostridiales bacterium]